MWLHNTAFIAFVGLSKTSSTEKNASTLEGRRNLLKLSFTEREDYAHRDEWLNINLDFSFTPALELIWTTFFFFFSFMWKPLVSLFTFSVLTPAEELVFRGWNPFTLVYFNWLILLQKDSVGFCIIRMVCFHRHVTFFLHNF